jgi:hypothetical protein
MNIQEQMKWNRRPTWFVYFMHDLFFSLRPPEIIWGKRPPMKFNSAIGYSELKNEKSCTLDSLGRCPLNKEA